MPGPSGSSSAGSTAAASPKKSKKEVPDEWKCNPQCTCEELKNISDVKKRITNERDHLLLVGFGNVF